MSEQSARDPYVGLNEHFRGQARGMIPAYYRIGKVLSVNPLRVRAAGMDLDKDDLRIAQHLIPGGTDALKNQNDWGVKSVLPTKTFYVRCSCGLSSGDAQVTRPEEVVQGAVPLATGDDVLLIPSDDGQIYYLVEKMVEVSE